jgi:hypothetical protein
LKVDPAIRKISRERSANAARNITGGKAMRETKPDTGDDKAMALLAAAMPGGAAGGGGGRA